MKKPIALALIATLLAPWAFAQEPILYPNKGQSQEQLEKDKYECYQWAKGQSGFDPLYPDGQAAAPPPPPPKQTAKSSQGVSTAQGAVAGALLGAGLGALLGGRRGVLTGAAVGGVGGAVVGSNQGAKADSYEEAKREAQARKNRENAGVADQKRDVYIRAMEACLEGRGYTIK